MRLAVAPTNSSGIVQPQTARRETVAATASALRLLRPNQSAQTFLDPLADTTGKQGRHAGNLQPDNQFLDEDVERAIEFHAADGQVDAESVFPFPRGFDVAHRGRILLFGPDERLIKTAADLVPLERVRHAYFN
jgi:hypothetical protein